MSFVNESLTNVTAGQQYHSLVGIVLSSALTTLTCCVFLFINGTLLYTLRSKSGFRETSRYLLLYNLLFADTVQLAESQVLFLFSAGRVMLSYPVCGILAFLSNLTFVISPLTLVVMSLERYVAVCYPLRHSSIITVRNTGLAIVLVWAFGSLNVLAHISLLLQFPFADLESLQMKDHCTISAMMLTQISYHFEEAFTCFLFAVAGVTVISSYIGVIVVARSASTDKASARKARNTMTLHLVQLGLSLLSTVHNPILATLSQIMSRVELLRIQIFIYMCTILLPRCLSALIYGLRDQTIRPVLMHHLCCRLNHTH
ncbi:odorant receptor 131-2-like [Mugil cephalus]|uniref:odorant receptor 131-2-like n=1 Tax=Mugil cephalus TaxID=48193 RepID=UPI001FB5C202|nr:odorant receptor 131-2-like [Mugil cephalus]